MIAGAVWLVPVLPLLAAAAIALRMLAGRDRGDAAERVTAGIAATAAGIAWLLVIALDILALTGGAPGQLRLGTWFAAGTLEVPISFLLDGLSLPAATLVATLVYLTLRFSASYLHRDTGFHRFFFAMSLFAAGMQLIALAGNAVLAFTGWELAGLSSWMLIGYRYERPTATGNALQAFVTNRVGDAGFLLGIALAFLWLNGVEWPAITAATGLSTLAAGLLAFGFATAALAKSAQLPFSPWIARALEGPTPSSAIFYGSLLVHAGVYLLIRLEPLLTQAPLLLALLAALGLLTASYGYLAGLTQSDVKSSLLFAATTQVGLMFLACGLGWFTLAAWHMGLHALWRAWQFLLAPSYLQFTDAPARPAPRWLAVRLPLYVAAVQRFALESLIAALVVRPTRALARDLRDLDDRVVSRLVGLPEESALAAARPAADEDSVIRGRGLAGRVLEWVAARLHRFEQRLLMQEGGGGVARTLHRLGRYLLAVETLLERPRYLLLILMITLVAIL
jgi:formate hydrogenlyase subunit 3/multisubunit Na+/H+ antiporter MnhD subunit